jgi:L-fuconolactonase
MSPRLDAHAHFFFPGIVDHLPESCRRLSPDEITLYQAHAQRHEITQVLAVGYEGDAWAAGNNGYLATLTAQHAWVRPVAFVASPDQLTIDQLVTWQAQRFVGITFYLFTPESAAALSLVPREVWRWLADHAWLISVNSTGDHWFSWQAILTATPELRLLIAHLGLPPGTTVAPSMDEARAVLTSVRQLASFPHVYVKFSGFYALAQPGYGYPHSPAWPYAQAITETFGTARILWASDFSPALEFVSFAQTVEVLTAISWLTTRDLTAIYHDNLAHLLFTTDERNS